MFSEESEAQGLELTISTHIKCVLRLWTWWFHATRDSVCSLILIYIYIYIYVQPSPPLVHLNNPMLKTVKMWTFQSKKLNSNQPNLRNPSEGKMNFLSFMKSSMTRLDIVLGKLTQMSKCLVGCLGYHVFDFIMMNLDLDLRMMESGWFDYVYWIL